MPSLKLSAKTFNAVFINSLSASIISNTFIENITFLIWLFVQLFFDILLISPAFSICGQS